MLIVFLLFGLFCAFMVFDGSMFTVAVESPYDFQNTLSYEFTKKITSYRLKHTYFVK